MKKLTKKYLVRANIKKVWNALTNVANITIWSGAKTKLELKEGAPFELWDGEVTGRTIKIIPNKELVQEWNFGNWQTPSLVKFLFVKIGEHTEVMLINENIPDNEFKDIETGWDEYVFEPIKEFLE